MLVCSRKVVEERSGSGREQSGNEIVHKES